MDYYDKSHLNEVVHFRAMKGKMIYKTTIS
jgi:hypothetical protein